MEPVVASTSRSPGQDEAVMKILPLCHIVNADLHQVICSGFARNAEKCASCIHQSWHQWSSIAIILRLIYTGFAGCQQASISLEEETSSSPYVVFLDIHEHDGVKSAHALRMVSTLQRKGAGSLLVGLRCSARLEDLWHCGSRPYKRTCFRGLDRRAYDLVGGVHQHRPRDSFEP